MEHEKHKKIRDKGKEIVHKPSEMHLRHLRTEAHEGKERKEKEPLMLISVNNILVALIIIGVVAAVYLYAQSDKPGGGTTTTTAYVNSYGTVNLEFYIMSQCPYGTQVEDAIKPVLDKLGNSVNFTLNYIANENTNGVFSSLHGPAEVDGDVMQLCAAKYYPSRYMAFIVCQNQDASKIQTNWQSCAQENGMDSSTLESCFKGSEGKQLMSASIKASKAANAQGSPTIFINGNQYKGARDSMSFMRALCAGLTDHPECASLPACVDDSDCTAQPTKDGRCINAGTASAKCEYSNPIPVDLVVLNSKACSSCDTTRIVSVSKQLFLGLTVREVEYNTTEGQQLASTYDIKMLPGYLFGPNITKAPTFAQVQNALVKVGGDHYLIHPQASGSNYNPTLVEIPRKLDLFVMSLCPYGIAAEQNMKEVLDLFGNGINFTLRFIAGKNADGSFSSLHGQSEVEEDIRQVCAMKHYPDKYYNYLLCIDEKPQSAADIWQDCAQKSGLDVPTMTACATGDEGKQLFTENIKLSGELGIGGSPTFLVNGKDQFTGALPADTIKQNICKANAGLEGCNKTLTGSGQAAVSPSGGCGA